MVEKRANARMLWQRYHTYGRYHHHITVAMRTGVQQSLGRSVKGNTRGNKHTQHTTHTYVAVASLPPPGETPCCVCSSSMYTHVIRSTRDGVRPVCGWSNDSWLHRSLAILIFRSSLLGCFIFYICVEKKPLQWALCYSECNVFVLLSSR